MRWSHIEKSASHAPWVALLLSFSFPTASAQECGHIAPKKQDAHFPQAVRTDDSTVVVHIDSDTAVTLPLSYVLEYKAGGKKEIATAQPHPADTATRYERHRQHAMKRWMRLIPSQATLQYAGSIGLVSAGIGWHYGKKDHWESEILIGVLPKYKSDEVSATFTLKERYVPWHCRVHRRWTIEPLTAGLFFNFIGGEDFWRRQPSRYPKNYYGFSTKVRTNIFLGQRLRFNIPRKRRLLHQAVSAYYEISTCDLYLVSKFTNKDYPWSETLSLALGLMWEM